jgi:hypothetical protein|tara:strand:+ start:3978 stop:4256 length:279 start_codon:yes stop_codon:yes gene_type:complete
MKKEVKELIQEELNSVKQSKQKVITGIILIIVNVVLILLNLIPAYTSLLTTILIILVWNQLMEYRINKSVLFLTRYIVDKEFAEEFDKINNK